MGSIRSTGDARLTALLDQGEAYEDWLLDRLADEWGFRLPRTTSYQAQRRHADAYILEIKHAPRLREFGAVCIEAYERRDAGRAWVESGILAQTTALLLAIGSRQEAYVFSLRTLRKIWATLQTGEASVVRKFPFYETPTSKGFRVRCADAAQVAEACYAWPAER